MHKVFIYTVAIMFYFLAGNSADPDRNSDTKKLDKHKGTVKTYKNKYGDIFDCVNIYQQPALDHQFLVNHTIQLKPTEYPKNIQCYQHSKIQKGWNIIDHCPKGTIPIIRSHKYDARNDNSYPKIEIAQVGTRTGAGPFYGAGAILEVWNPRVVHPSEISLAQVKLVTYYGSSEENSISAGWIVDEPHTHVTKFFIRSTRDIGHQHTQCYNLECAGFVQINHQVEIGGALHIHSELAILINRDENTGHWWLFKDCVPVGYWPYNIFLGQSAEVALFGGEIINLNHGGYHTTTEMGNGKHPCWREHAAASIKFIKVVEHLGDDMHLIDLGNSESYVTNPSFYDVVRTLPLPTTPGVTIHYGGFTQ